jgi:hypothetical protein
MTSRTLSKRLERLETRILLAREPWKIKFISAVDGTITKRLQATCAARLPGAGARVPHA